MGAYWRSGGVPPRHILDLGTGWGWVVVLAPRSLCPRSTLNGGLCGPRSQSGRCRGGEGPCWKSNPCRRICVLVAVLAEVPRLQQYELNPVSVPIKFLI
jgi:hypothetical protein